MEQRQFITDLSDEGLRLDIFLREQTDLSRSRIQKLIKDGSVSIDGAAVVKTSTLISGGATIDLVIPPAEEVDIKPEPMELDIVYEDKDVIVINKPKNMVVHPAPGHTEHTLVNGLMYHCGDELSGINGELRPGIVHRIDKDTTGLLVACKNDLAHNILAKQFAMHTITRRYQAIVYNNFKEDTGTIDKPIARDAKDRKKMSVTQKDGRRAVTHYRVLDHLNNSFNHIECRLETGRTHQIRVHMAYIRHPLLGDKIYGPATENKIKNLTGQALHAGILGFVHPTSGQYMEFESKLPQYFVELLEMLGK